MVLQTNAPLQHNYRTSGSLEGWQDGIGKLAVGNSRLVLAISLAFAAPMLRQLGIEGGGVHFRGASSTGKTTAGEAAGSVCGGGPDGYKQTWRATDNAIEAVAAVHNDGLLVLDEIGQVSADALGAAAYMLANGQGKQRMTRDAAARAVPTWRLLFLSTGEIGLADKMRESKRGSGRVMAGQQVRVIELPADAGADHGLFDTLHGFATGQALADHLKDATGKHYGHPLRAFLQRLVTETWTDGARAFIERFVSEVVPIGADGQVRRAAQRFALVAAAGEMARRWSILPWSEGEAIGGCQAAVRRVARCTRRDRARGDRGRAYGRSSLHRSARHQPVRAAGPSPDRVRAEPCRLLAARRRRLALLCSAGGMARSTCSLATTPGMIAREMVKRGMLKATADGKPQTKQRLPDGS